MLKRLKSNKRQNRENEKKVKIEKMLKTLKSNKRQNRENVKNVKIKKT